MKTHLFLLIASLALPPFASAQAPKTGDCCKPSASFSEGGHVGGGDLCKNEIDKHRLAILGWIQRDEAKDLDFSKAKVAGLIYDKYRNPMLDVLQEGRVIVTCYLDPSRISDPQAKNITEKEGVSYRGISIGNPPNPTTCINYEDVAGKSHIDCNYDAILAQVANGSPNYVLTHHEFASIAGVELRTDGYQSDFSVSNLLSEFERWQITRTLGPKLSSSLNLVSKRCQSRISGLVDFIADRCAPEFLAVLNPLLELQSQPGGGWPMDKINLLSSFRYCMDMKMWDWLGGDGHRCGGPVATNECILRMCGPLNFNEECTKACSRF